MQRNFIFVPNSESLEVPLMRLTSFGIVLVLVTSFAADQGNAQIPERVLFQPGSYAFGPYYSAISTDVAEPVVLPIDAVPAEESTETENKTEWETTFGVEEPQQNNKTNLIQTGSFISLKPTTIPYLAYHRDPLTHRIHVVPYQPGYAADPEAFPKHQSQLNLWLSTLPCREQNHQQVQYADYYDPDPVIITDKPSRLQLILGYSNALWTSCCENRWGVRLAQCPEVEPVALGPYAEIGIKDQPVAAGHPQPLGGIFAGPRLLNHGQALPLPPPHNHSLAHYPVYSREELRPIIAQRTSYAAETRAVPVPQSIPYPPSANHETPLPPPKELQPKTIQTAQPLSPCTDNQSSKECKECKKHANPCPPTSCKSCTTKNTHRPLKSKKTACGTENKDGTENKEK
ncbi:MAG: hypothetical protein LBE12_01495 [Planctomycetaceae bacterium]|nr:hypothetical protein [Planctomycetaceae bacterium]